ncbi:LysM peptidoglycan-binding domain-containing protein [Clostridium sp. E02]|uniref:LysM peptidoglycan-binding domain-containing protein n=1 Tax=Clostridium sp. E02 TaxID=2487134 RepID=UPI000F53F0C9|nr:LysM peptidoglycan-binding domain-containing protein [Clostridium sp. E02]
MIKQFISLVLVVVIGSYVCGYSLVKALAGEAEAQLLETYYTSILIQDGDSLWSIAEKYGRNSGMNKAEYVKELKNMNGIKEDVIHSGKYLTVAYYVPYIEE